MKPKSMKLRALLTFYTFFKHVDEEHRLTSVELNKVLAPYNLQCHRRVLHDTVNVMKEFGLDVRFKGEWDKQGFWIENRPLKDDKLNALVFAVSTNPFLSNEQATEILQEIALFVTVYQEQKLCCDLRSGDVAKGNQAVYDAYVTLSEAIRTNRRVRYTLIRVRHNKKTGEVYEEHEWRKLFTPRYLYQEANRIYAVGYVHPNKRVEAVDLADMLDVKFAFKNVEYPQGSNVKKILDEINPRDYIPEERRELIYKGPATFYCRGQFVEELYRHFGQPEGPVEKDVRCRSKYTVSDVEIWPDTLTWLSEAPDNGIRIVGPSTLVEAVKNYYSKTSETLLNPYISAKKK